MYHWKRSGLRLIMLQMEKIAIRRSHLENLYFRKRTNKSLKAYKEQKNYCSRHYKKERKKLFNKLNLSFVKKSSLWWKTFRPFF